jgi:hypothetical protein
MRRAVRLDVKRYARLSRPGKATDNAFAESSDGRSLDECRDTLRPLSIENTKDKIIEA